MKQLPSEHAIYYEGTNGVGVILFHAYTGSPYDVNLVARTLHRSGYSVLLPDFTGHNQQPIDQLLETTPDQWWQDTVENIQWMQALGFESLFAFGLSMGGIYATAALATPEFKLTGGGTFNSPVASQQRINLDVPFSRYVNYIAKKYDTVEETKQQMDQIMAQHHEQLEELVAFSRGYKTRLGVIEQPFLIVQSGRDEMVSRTTGEELMAQLTNSPVTYLYLPENTHVVTTNRNRQLFENALLGFLDQYQTN